jgi:ABC-type branched-subunit amino acid transport system substrate-binding protein
MSRAARVGARRGAAPISLLLVTLAAVLPACRTTAPLIVARVVVAAPLASERAVAGRDVVDAVRLAVEEWQADAPAAGRLRLELVTVDEGATEPLRALLRDPHLLLVVGFTDEAAATTARGLLAAPDAPAGVALANPGPGGRPAGLVELAPTTRQVQEVVAAALAYNFGPMPVAVIASADPEAVAAAQAFAALAPGRELPVRALFTLGGEDTDFMRLAQAVRAPAPQLVYVIGDGVDAGSLWAELRLRDARARLVLGPGVLSEGFYRTAGGFFDGVSALELTPQPAESERARDFFARFSARYGRAPTALAGRAYDAAALGLAAVRAAAADTPTRPAVRAALAAVTSYQGVMRTYELADGAPTRWPLAMYRLGRDGAPTLIGEPEIP